MTTAIRLPRRPFGRRRTKRLLSEAEARYRMLIERAPVCILGIDRTARIVSINGAGLAMLGLGQAEALGLSYLDFVGAEDRSRVAALLSQALEGAAPELEFESADGERSFAASFIPVCAEDGEVATLIGVMEDISERLRSERALREGEARLRALIDASPLALVELDPDRTVRYCNAAAEALFGWSSEELRGGILPTIPPEVAEEAEDLHARVFGGEAVSRRTRRRRRDGSLVDVELWVGPIVGADGAVSGGVGLFTDITERVNAEAALRTSEERYRELFENARELIVTTDLEGRIATVNRAVETASGYERAELVGRPLGAFFTPDALERTVEHFESVLRGEDDGSAASYAIRCQDGRELPIEASVQAIREAGEPLGLQLIARDVSERLRLEAQLRQAQKMEAVGRLAGGIAHDFNNLLTAISGYADLALLGLPAGSIRLAEDIGEVIRAAERASALTQQLLAFSRTHAVRSSKLDLVTLLAGMEGMLRRLIGEDVRLALRRPTQPCWVEADPSGLEQVVLNLVVNARDAMPDGGRLAIELDVVVVGVDTAEALGLRPGEHVRLAVADTGCGMDEEVRARVFEPFFTTKEVGKGTGLGLATVYGVVEQSGGAVTFDSTPGRGTTFVVYLPRVSGDPAGEPAPAESESAGGAETILLVEDDDMVRELARRVLARAGYEVLEARFGSEAIAMSNRRHGPIDLVLTDLVMPGMSGRELGARLARLRPEMRRLFMSGYAGEGFDGRNLDGADGFIGKPFSPEELVQKVREVLDHTVEAADAA